MSDEEWSLEGKDYMVLMDEYDVEPTVVYKKDDIKTLHSELQKDKQELQNKILARISGLLSPPLPSDYNLKNTSQLILDISGVINEEFRKYEEKMDRRFGNKEGDNLNEGEWDIDKEEIKKQVKEDAVVKDACSRVCRGKYGIATIDIEDAIDKAIELTVDEVLKKVNAEEDSIYQKLVEDVNNQIKSIGMFPADTDCRKTCKEIIMSELRKVRNIINKCFEVENE